jgi:signal peptidase
LITDVLPLTEEAIITSLRESKYGRCVFACDNNVVDNQTTIMQFENGVTATLKMVGFTDRGGRDFRLFGTEGEIEIIEEEGEIFFRTRGDNNNTDDKKPVPTENLVGIYRTRVPGAGHVAMFMQSTTGLVLCVVLPIVLLISYDVVRRSIYEKNKKADTDALLAELEALRAEKAKAAVSAENSENE